ncbi:hypothetical protein ABBQ38_011602 [Trebouxia sp. C0009 RCD-2024]
MIATQLSTAIKHTRAHSAAGRFNDKAAVVSRSAVHSVQRPKQRSQSHAKLTTCRAVKEQTATSAGPSTEWFQKIVQLPAKQRGCHIITRNLLQELPELGEYEVGMANLFVMHTSASLTINENASSDVPLDLNDSLDRIAPEGPHYRHADEGSDDMPAHVKSSLMGASLNIPVRQGQFAMGTWQGLYLNEHRNHGGSRKVCVTIQGQKRSDGRKYPASRW